MLVYAMIAALASAQPAAPAAGSSNPSDNEITCRSRPVLGSRISRQRICKTRAEWRAYDTDLEQSRRDIADRGARGCDLSQGGNEC